ncbi:hypothetical protein M3Y96_01200000 [Aphelenchoides besseyi]|nr:hypothetical protein M3Y96_01200000 [Aphelenchoides besseyi]
MCFMAVADLLFVAIDYTLYRQNIHQIKNKILNYTLRRSFLLRELQISIRLLFPLCLTHVVFFLPFLIIYFLNPLFEGAQQSKSLYNAIIPLTLVILLHRRPTEINEWKQPTLQLTDEYFRQFNAQLK